MTCINNEENNSEKKNAYPSKLGYKERWLPIQILVDDHDFLGASIDEIWYGQI